MKAKYGVNYKDNSEILPFKRRRIHKIKLAKGKAAVKSGIIARSSRSRSKLEEDPTIKINKGVRIKRK